jgi:hypothetical protein
MTIEQLQTKVQPIVNQLNALLESVTEEISTLQDKENPTDAQQEKLDAFESAESYLQTAIDELQSI